ITSSDSYTTYDLGKYYAILPQVPYFKLDDFIQHFNATKVPEGFRYSSDANADWVSAFEINQLIQTNKITTHGQEN
ncbi:MAG: UDP-N-acetylglucosamine 4,6-dehydratase (inverting), partial [Flavobacteriales bacterium]